MMNILGSWFVVITFCLATIIRAEIRKVRTIITPERRSIKMWSEKNSSPEGGSVMKDRAVIQKKAKVEEFQSCFTGW